MLVFFIPAAKFLVLPVTLRWEFGLCEGESGKIPIGDLLLLYPPPGWAAPAGPCWAPWLVAKAGINHRSSIARCRLPSFAYSRGGSAFKLPKVSQKKWSFFPLVALRSVWEMMLRLWRAWQRVTPMEACCLFQKHGLFQTHAGKRQPSLCSRPDPEGPGLAVAQGDPLTR